MVADAMEVTFRKISVVDLGFLHAKDVGLVLFEPRNHNMQARPYRIHVEGCNFEHEPSLRFKNKSF
jgi:hypothetical protein